MLQLECGKYIKNGGNGVVSSSGCCELLQQAAGEVVDASIVYCLCHGAKVNKPLTAMKIVEACALSVDYNVNLICKKKG